MEENHNCCVVPYGRPLPNRTFSVVTWVVATAMAASLIGSLLEGSVSLAPNPSGFRALVKRTGYRNTLGGNRHQLTLENHPSTEAEHRSPLGGNGDGENVIFRDGTVLPGEIAA